jgi:P-type conjugative transfer protein TrbJ
MSGWRYTVCVLSVLLLRPARPAAAQWVVTDPGSIIEETLSVLQEVAENAQLVLSYKTQLDQYAGQLRDAVAPAIYIWDKTEQTIHNVEAVTKTLENYKGLTGDLDAALKRFGDIDYYRQSPCYSAAATRGDCQAYIKAFGDRERLSSANQKAANDALFKTLDNQQRDLQARTDRLDQLQKNATTAKGQLEAAQYANQLASAQITELMELRGLLLAQQNIAAMQTQASLDRSAAQRVADENFLQATVKKSPPREW